ncbi:hypothetical protein YC68_24580, partial [Vibrio parahaemolyticus]
MSIIPSDFWRISRDVIFGRFWQKWKGYTLPTFSFLAKFQIWLKIHDLDSELNENHGNQVYFSIGLIVF